MGCLINASSTDTPAKLLKLELGCQLPMKSYYKLKCDVVKCLRDDNHRASELDRNVEILVSSNWHYQIRKSIFFMNVQFRHFIQAKDQTAIPRDLLH